MTALAPLVAAAAQVLPRLKAQMAGRPAVAALAREFAAARRETGGYQVTIQIPFERARA